MNMIKHKKPFFILIPISLFFAVGVIVMLLWNWLVPDIFGLGTITYLQAFGLLLLSRILFGNFSGGKRKSRFAQNRFKEKMMGMTDEERQKFKDEWKKRCSR